MQYFFVDESGDAGLTNKGSAYYVVAMVQLPNRESLTELVALRQKLRLSSNFEFHYYKMNSRQKDEFFQAVQPLAFRVRAAALIKSHLPMKFQSMSSTELATDLLVNLTLRAAPLILPMMFWFWIMRLTVLSNPCESILQRHINR